MVTSSDLRSLGRELDSVTRPDPRQYVEQILLWMICWPWNLVWTLLVHNPLRQIVQFVVIEVRSTLEEISSGEFKEIERDLAIEEVPLAPAAPFDPYARTNWHVETPVAPVATAQPRDPRFSEAPTTQHPPAPHVAAPHAAAPPQYAGPAYVPPPAPAPVRTPPPAPKDEWLASRDTAAPDQSGDDAWPQDPWPPTK